MVTTRKESLYATLIDGQKPSSLTFVRDVTAKHTVSCDRTRADRRAARARERFDQARSRAALAHQASIDSTLALVRATNPGFRKTA